MTKIITKASGEQEEFSTKKFQSSLRKAGANPELIQSITDAVVNDPSMTSTRAIYTYAFNQLHKQYPPAAARYNLKFALAGLGPSGYPFERFVAELFKHKGFETKVGQLIPGFCVTHEVDVILTKKNLHIMAECKFHQPHLKADIKVPLYIKARFDDIQKQLNGNQNIAFDEVWIVTNTKFTTQATAYAECVGIKLISWSYPAQNNIAQMIDAIGFQPITVLTSLTQKQKNTLINEGIVLCKDLMNAQKLLERIGLSGKKIGYVLDEARRVYELGLIT
jgi:HJR/Mrr/RecB family endonuclease